MDFSTNRFSLDYALTCDAQDQLALFASEFVVDDQDGPNRLIYLDGNSLGRLPRRSIPFIENSVKEQWGHNLIKSWNDGWYAAPQRIGDKIGRLIGAASGQVITCDSTTINLYKLTLAGLKMRPERSKIISDTMNFPSDLYILQGCIDALGNRHSLQQIPSEDSISPDLSSLYSSIDQDTALVTLSHVVFKSGFLYDAAEITRRAHSMGALVLWDLSHSVGAVPIELDQWNVDFAVGCTYKYLNGGPGAPAFLYVRSDLQEQAISPIWGWFGQKSPFEFDLTYRPANGIARFMAGTPAIISLQAIEPGIDIIIEAGIDRIREKSIAQTSYLIDLFDEYLAPLGFQLGSPRAASQRGSHVSIRHSEGYRINRALIDEMRVIPDFREPDNIRLGITPLYTRYIDIWETISRVAMVIKENRHMRYAVDRSAVT